MFLRCREGYREVTVYFLGDQTQISVYLVSHLTFFSSSSHFSGFCGIITLLLSSSTHIYIIIYMRFYQAKPSLFILTSLICRICPLNIRKYSLSSSQHKQSFIFLLYWLTQLRAVYQADSVSTVCVFVWDSAEGWPCMLASSPFSLSCLFFGLSLSLLTCLLSQLSFCLSHIFTLDAEDEWE